MSRRCAEKKLYSGSGLLGSIAQVASGVVNKAIDLLPVELHIPGGYQYCGPGTNLDKRLRRGDPGINKLDAACKVHDIAYSKFSDNKSRSEADRVLAESAWERVKSSDSSLSEKAAAWMVTNIMKAKSKLGAGRRKVNISKKKPKRVRKRRGNGAQKPRKVVKRVRRKAVKKGKGLYLKPYSGSGCSKKKKHTRQK